MCFSRRAAVLLLLFLLSSAALEAQVTPQGNDFLVNGAIAGYQSSPDVAADALGNFVVVWRSSAPSGDGDGSGVVGQRFRFDGFPLGGGFQVNTYTTGSQFSPSVAMDDVGSFVVVWASGGYPGPGPDGDGSAIRGQRYSFDGSPVGSELQINLFTSGNQLSPSVGNNGGGTFVVVWEGMSGSIRARSFASDGTPISTEVLIGSGAQPDVAVSVSAFLAVWGDHPTEPDFAAAQTFFLDATPQSSVFAVNDTQPGGFPAVAGTESGSFVVAWASRKIGEAGIMARKVNSNGSFATGEIVVDGLGTGLQPDVASDEEGNFVAVWHNESDGSGLGVRGQGVAADGTLVGAEFQVNTYTTDHQWFPAVASGDDGEIAVVWTGQDGNSLGIKGRRFQLDVPEGPDPLIFEDGFETGNTSRWSSVQP